MRYLPLFFGVTLGLFDFLADSLQIKKDPRGKLTVCSFIFLPPLVIAISYPDIFITALKYAGGYGSALLLGLLPIVMAMSQRQKYPEAKQLIPGGFCMLILLALFVFFELGIEIGQ